MLLSCTWAQLGCLECAQLLCIFKFCTNSSTVDHIDINAKLWNHKPFRTSNSAAFLLSNVLKYNTDIKLYCDSWYLRLIMALNLIQMNVRVFKEPRGASQSAAEARYLVRRCCCPSSSSCRWTTGQTPCGWAESAAAAGRACRDTPWWSGSAGISTPG